MFGIGDVAHRLSAVLDAVTGRAIWMVQRSCSNGHFVEQIERIASVEIFKRHLGAHQLKRHGEGRLRHRPGKNFFDAALVNQVAGHDDEFVPFGKGRREERKPVDVIPVRVGHQQTGGRNSLALEPVTKISDPGPGVQDEPVTVDRNFDTAGVPAKGDVARGWACDATADAPELDLKAHYLMFSSEMPNL